METTRDSWDLARATPTQEALDQLEALKPYVENSCWRKFNTWLPLVGNTWRELADFKLIKQLELEKGQDEIAQYEEDMQLFISNDGNSCFDLETDQGLAESNSVSFWIGCVLKRTILWRCLSHRRQLK